MNINIDPHVHLVFCSYSKTIRQQPQNYCLAVWDEKRNHWAMDPDLAAAKELIIGLTIAISEFEIKNCMIADVVSTRAEEVISDCKQNNILSRR